jgi:hypothetical protein
MSREREGSTISNQTGYSQREPTIKLSNVPLHKGHPTLFTIHEIAPQRIYHHEDQLIEWCVGRRLPPLSHMLVPSQLFISRQPWHDRLVREEARREHQNRDWDQHIREHEGECLACHGDH